MQTSFSIPSPFAMLIDPESIVDAMNRSERLARLQSRICRPLDKPMNGVAVEDDANSPNSGDEYGGIPLA